MLENKKFDKRLQEAIEEPCRIEIISTGKDQTVTLEGKQGTILINLAGLEKTILERLGVTESEFRAIKLFIGTEQIKEIDE